jgi:hypothetical protein
VNVDTLDESTRKALEFSSSIYHSRAWVLVHCARRDTFMLTSSVAATVRAVSLAEAFRQTVNEVV